MVQKPRVLGRCCVKAADEIRDGRQHQGVGADHPDVTGGVAAHPSEWALHLPEGTVNLLGRKSGSGEIEPKWAR